MIIRVKFATVCKKCGHGLDVGDEASWPTTHAPKSGHGTANLRDPRRLSTVDCLACAKLRVPPPTFLPVPWH